MLIDLCLATSRLQFGRALVSVFLVVLASLIIAEIVCCYRFVSVVS